jgi:hypothetical protein
MSNNNLFNFLTDIAVNPEQQIAFLKQHDAVTVAFGLSEADQTLVKSRNSNKIAAVFANEIDWSAVVCCDPNPEDPFPDPDPEPEPNPEQDSPQDFNKNKF